MTLDYSADHTNEPSKHDFIYTTLLGVLAFFLLLGILSQLWMMQLPGIKGNARSLFLLDIAIEGAFLVVILVVGIVRIVSPATRKWPTFGLNLILLIFIPIGTALAIYGFWKVDKRLPIA